MNLRDFLLSVLCGTVEGITEWLPVSSTGHLILLREFLPLGMEDRFWEVFLVVVQLGAVLAVAVLYRHTVFPAVLRGGRPVLRRETCMLWGRILLACVPGGLYALLLEDRIGDRFFGYHTVAVMLIAVGIVFLFAERRLRKRGSLRREITESTAIPWKTAFLIGIFQLAAAIFPGTSRSGATIVGGLLLGLSRTAAAEFTFFLALPVMAGESLLRLLSCAGSFSVREWAMLLVGTGTAFAVSLAVIRFLLDYIRRRDFRVFAWYRILLGITVLLYFGLA